MGAWDFESLKNHVGHKIICVGYGDSKDYENVAIECVDCDEVLMDYDKYPEEEGD
jgi:hypothetical protein